MLAIVISLTPVKYEICWSGKLDPESLELKEVCWKENEESLLRNER